MWEMFLEVFIIPWENMLHLTFSKTVRPSSINGWLYTFLNKFNVSKAVVSDLHCERGDINLI